DAHGHGDAGVLEKVRGVLGELVDRDAVRVDALAGVSPRPAEPDADHREAEVVGGLDEVTREDAEPAGVGRELLVEAVLHAEVRDGRRQAARGQRGGGYTPGRFSRNATIASRPSGVIELEAITSHACAYAASTSRSIVS